MRFYGYFRSSAAYRCRIAFNLKGVAPDFAPIHLRRGDQRQAEYRGINPQGLVPALDIGWRILTQSLAIIEWLGGMHPHPALLPGDAADPARIRALPPAVAADIPPPNNLRGLKNPKNPPRDHHAAVAAPDR